MDEIEVPTEQLHEELHHRAEHSTEKWIGQVALSSALFAVLAAIAALLAGHHSNEAVISEIRASDKWAYFQSKGIKADVLDSRLSLLAALGKPPRSADLDRQRKLGADKEKIQEEARELEREGRAHLDIHLAFAKAVTFFQVTIAIGAISALTKRRWFWWVSLACGAVGLCFFVAAFLVR